MLVDACRGTLLSKGKKRKKKSEHLSPRDVRSSQRYITTHLFALCAGHLSSAAHTMLFVTSLIVVDYSANYA